MVSVVDSTSCDAGLNLDYGQHFLFNDEITVPNDIVCWSSFAKCNIFQYNHIDAIESAHLCLMRN